MKTIILAAGRGSRMEALTNNTPKCMTKLLNKSLLEWQLAALKAAEIDDIVIVRGYQKDCIQGDFRTLENPNWENTNMVMTLDCASEEFSETSIIAYSDILYHPNHIKKLRKAKGDIVLCYDTAWRTLWELRFDDPLEDAETFEECDGKLQSIGAKTSDIEDIKGQYMGLLKVTPKGWGIIKSHLDKLHEAERNKLDLTSLLQALLSEGASISTIAIKGKWVEADDSDDLKKYDDQIKLNEQNGTIWSHDWRIK